MKVRTVAFLSGLVFLAACGAKSPTAVTEPAQTPPAARHDGTGFLGGGS